jgi:hypothetical protein
VRRLALSAVLLTALLAAPARAELLYATNGTTIARFDSASLGSVTTTGAITGMQAGDTLVGIDVRPLDGRLYGVGSTSRLYRLDPITGTASVVNASPFATGLNGTAFGTDFNPVPDRLRVVSNTEQNLRINPVDGTLSFNDTALTPAGNIVAAAYSNNVLGATTTTLFDIDSAAGTLVVQNPPNAGNLTTVGALGLGTNLNEAVGFDISGRTGVAYATLTTGGISRLYTVNLATGAATLVGTIGAGSSPYLGVAASMPAFVRAQGPASTGGEGSTLQFRVSRDGTALATSVQYATTDDSAKAGEDYTAATGTLTWAAGDTSERTVDVPVLDDTATEDAEAFGLALSNPGADTQVTGATASATIAASDPAVATPTPTPTPSPAPTATPTPTPADRTPPALVLTAARTQKIAGVRRKGIAAAATSSERCLLQVDATLSARDARRLKLPRRIARAAAVAPAARLAVRLELTAKAASRLKRVKRQAISLSATCEDAAGNRSAPAVARFTLKR